MTCRHLQGIVIVGLAFGFGVLCGRFGGRPEAREVSTTRLSPDETLRAWVSPHQRGWLESHARDFGKSPTIGIDRVATGELLVLLSSGYSSLGGPSGSERLVWSRDSSMLLIIGRHFFVRDDLMLDNGDQLYFLHDLKTGRSWSNASDNVQFPPLIANQIAGVAFTEPVILKPRARVDPEFFEKAE